MSAPDWLQLLAPIPHGTRPQRKPVASAEMLANGTAGPIAGWENITVHISGELGSRHVLIVLDEHGKLLSAGDHVMWVRQSDEDGVVRISDHESIGGRFDERGGFAGTRWMNRIECEAGEDEGTATSSSNTTPSEQDVARLKALIADLLARL